DELPVQPGCGQRKTARECSRAAGGRWCCGNSVAHTPSTTAPIRGRPVVDVSGVTVHGQHGSSLPEGGVAVKRGLARAFVSLARLIGTIHGMALAVGSAVHQAAAR